MHRFKAVNINDSVLNGMLLEKLKVIFLPSFAEYICCRILKLTYKVRPRRKIDSGNPGFGMSILVKARYK